MGTTLIKAKITDQILEFTLKPVVASGGVNEDVIEFEFDTLWDGFDMVAVFYRSKREVFHQKIVDNRCTVPSEVLRAQGVFYVGVMGVKDNVTRTTNVLRYELEHGAITEGVEPPEPTPSIYEQILETVKSAEQIAKSVRDDADAGRFNGAPGVQGPKGDQGEKGDPGKDAPRETVLYTQQALTPDQQSQARENIGAVSSDDIPTIDATLSQAGQAADAKAAGDAIAQKAQINDTAVDGDAWSSKQIIDTLCPPIEMTGNPVVCHPIAGYPLGVKAEWEPVQE